MSLWMIKQGEIFEFFPGCPFPYLGNMNNLHGKMGIRQMSRVRETDYSCDPAEPSEIRSLYSRIKPRLKSEFSSEEGYIYRWRRKAGNVDIPEELEIPR